MSLLDAISSEGFLAKRELALLALMLSCFIYIVENGQHLKEKNLQISQADGNRLRLHSQMLLLWYNRCQETF
ncbi:hypothetical protein TorRG33x02_211480 [Trema orientale]|uniref:Uncharacterized protein n=1 Tax=Trema orientale TaxID=63057 RepID=A0A2P5EBX1_TREOI|nr:hypothetical protein TorRG33x02_211480 [Trema orientale]